MDSMDDYYHGGEGGDGGSAVPTTTTTTTTSIENDSQQVNDHPDIDNNGGDQHHHHQIHHTMNDYDSNNNNVNGDEQQHQLQQSQLPIPDDNCKIFVGALSWQTTEDALRLHFEKYGSVYSVEVVRDRHTGDPRGFAFVIFHDESSVDNVMSDKNKNQFHERLVDVKRFQGKVAPRIPSTFDKDTLLPPSSSMSSSAAVSSSSSSQIPSYGRSSSMVDTYRGASSSSGRNGGSTSNDPDEYRLFVGGMAPDIDRNELRRVFEGFGTVIDASIMIDPNTMRSRGYGFIVFDRITGQKAIDRIMRIPNIQVRGKNVEVRRSRSSTEPGGSSSDIGRGGGMGNIPSSSRDIDRFVDSYDTRGGSSSAMRRDSSGRGSDYGLTSAPPMAGVEPHTCELFVGSLPFDVDRVELKRIFDLFGTVIDAIVVIDPASQRSRGFGFVTFDPSDGPNAIERVIRAAPLQVRGRNIEVKRAKPPIESGPSGGGGGSSSQRPMGGRSGSNVGGGGGDLRGRDASPLQGGLYPHKIFVGGLPPDVDRMELRRLFERYGEVLDTIVMIDPATHRSRCFGFVTFDRDYGAEAVERVIRAQPIQIGGRSVEIRRARPPTEMEGGGAGGGGGGGNVGQHQRDLAPMHRSAPDDYDDVRNNNHDDMPVRHMTDTMQQPTDNQSNLFKIFVGGLAPDIDRDELRRVFERFGEVVDAIVMIDPDTKRSRGFGFVTFDDIDGQKATDHIMQIQPMQVHGRTVEVKLASPQPTSDDGPKNLPPHSINEDRVRTELPPEQSQYRVFVGGLPPEVDKVELKQIFERFGVVIDAVVMIDAATHRSRGFGFVTFDEEDGPHSIDRALQAQPLQVHGRSVEIRRGRPPNPPGEGRGTKRNVDHSDSRGGGGGRDYRSGRSNDYDDVRPPSPDYDRRLNDDVDDHDDERYKRSRY